MRLAVAVLLNPLFSPIIKKYPTASPCWTFVMFDIWVTGPHVTVPMARGREGLVAFFNWACPCFVDMDGVLKCWSSA